MHSANFFDIKAGRFPLTCHWEITCRCNLHCVMCYTDCFNKPEKIRQELSAPEIHRIMDELAAEGCLEITITGGEPLSRPDFWEIYEYGIKKGFLITVFSNGTLIDEKIADRFGANPPQAIEISLHGVTAATFERVTAGKGSFVKCMHAIELLVERKIPLMLKATAMTLNKDELLAVKRFARSLGPRVNFMMGHEMVPTLELNSSPAQYQLLEEEFAALAADDAELSSECETVKTEGVYTCVSGLRKFHIDSYGNLNLCSGNRRMSYDLKKGSFKQGFYEFLPTFACPFKPKTPAAQMKDAHV
jgi:MoaA/NifB/PqqE/SkfB family radical SAM enzyme